nr:protein-tyrosine phosphatase family protein [Microbacterium sp. CFH 90308]
MKWRDFGLPQSTDDALIVLREAHARAESERVEIACDGGNGRTGTALSVLAMMSGIDPENAVNWVRAHYRATAVETPRQRRWVSEVSARLRVEGERPDA